MKIQELLNEVKQRSLQPQDETYVEAKLLSEKWTSKGINL